MLLCMSSHHIHHGLHWPFQYMARAATWVGTTGHAKSHKYTRAE